MSTNVIMPQLGESVVEGTVGKWLKREGEWVNEYDPILEVTTDKVDTEIPSPAAGVLLKVLVLEGATVKAGTVLGLIGQPGEAPGDDGDHAPEKQLVAAAAPGVPRGMATVPTRPNGQPQRAGGALARRDLGFISPVVAKLAEEHNLDLQQLTGTGQGGRITKKDVLAFVDAHSSTPGQAQSAQPEVPQPETPTELPPWEKPGEGDLFRPTELQFGTGQPDQTDQTLRVLETLRVSETLRVLPAGDESIPVEGMRKLIAEHMVRSERTAPHVTTVFEADLSAVLAHQAAHSAEFARDGATLTLTAYFVAAAVAALKAVPIVNSQWAEDRILLKREINIGLAVALEAGLIVPVIPRADEKSLLGLARAINDLARRARAKALKPDEVQGGTFTLTNHGVSGSLFATPIINQPQTAILGAGVMQKRVVVINDAIAIRPMIYLTLTFDHRVLDGAVADRFMGKLKEALEGWR